MVPTVVIFEDNHHLRAMLREILNHGEEFTVIGDFEDGREAAKEISFLLPDIVIMDIDMPNGDGISLLPQIKEIHPSALIVMYTQFEDDDKLFKSICAGADGYILKKTPPGNLLIVLKELASGGAPMSPSIAKKVLASFRKVPQKFSNKYQLTQREVDVLKLLIQGCSVKFIAAELGIAFETCRSHLKNIYIKLQVNCGKEAIAKVLAEKIAL
jgi:DNA-binding NarL/FixJ family response regulator